MGLNELIGSLVPTAFGYGGSLMGSMVGPLGSIAGGVLGKKGGEWLNNYVNGGSSSPSYYDQLQSAQSGLLSQLQNQPQFKPVDIDPYLQEARREYNEEIAPAIAHRFGGMGAQNSSAFNNAIAQAGSGLAQKLAQLRTSHAQDQQSKELQSRELGLRQLGLLGDFTNKQNQLNQSSWDPYLKAGQMFLDYNQGNLGRQQAATKQKIAMQQRAQEAGLGQQYQTYYHPGSSGIMPYVAPAIAGGGKIAMSFL